MKPVDLHHISADLTFSDPLTLTASSELAQLPAHELGRVDIVWISPEGRDAAGL